MSLRSLRTTAICAATTAFAMVAAACNNDHGDEPAAMASVNLNYIWPDTLVGAPEAMSAVFFPESSGGMIWRFTVDGAKGATVSVPAGRYRVMTYTADHLLDVDIESSLAESTVAIPESQNGRFTAPDHMMWGANTVAIDFEPGSRNQSITFVAAPITAQYRIEIVSLVDSKGRALAFYPTAAAGTLDGMAEELSLDNGQPADLPPVSLGFSLSSPRSGEIPLAGRLVSLGSARPVYSGSRNVNMLTVTFTDPTGVEWNGAYDATAQIARAPYPKALTIVVDTLAVAPSSSAITPWSPVEGIDGWAPVIIDFNS